ncbi:Carotenoid cis-trans isomerase [Chitinispirillum alkaliphilum]|nr:Carotenoid cis-trans isomerase [Chitinispirillum alkaliphilum]
MQNKQIIIIGGGIAGLSAGSYLARNGYQTLIFEKHSVPGGLCTAWKRKGYTIDYCIHWLLGTKKGTGFDKIWDELGAFVHDDGSRSAICNFEDFTRIDLPNGDTLTLYSDADKLEKEMLRVAPEDKVRIVSLCRDIRRMSKVKFPVDSRALEKVKWMGYLLANIGSFSSMIKHMRTPLSTFISGFKNPYMRQALGAGVPQDWSTAALLFGLAVQHTRGAGYPVGGSLRFAKNMERNYLNFGGQIRYNAPVASIIVEQNKAVGVRLENGEEIRGEYVVSAADGHETLFEMLGGRFLSEKLKHAYSSFPLFPSSVFLGFGVAKDFSEFPHSINIATDNYSLPDGTKPPFISLTIYNFDPTLAPEGKTVITALINTWNDLYWRELAQSDRKKYEQVKKEIEERVLDIIEKKLGSIREFIEVSDVSTPHTVHRYTGNWRGSYEGFGITPETFSAKLPKTLPGLSNFFMIGQWTTPGGGLPPAAKDGRDLAQKICKLDKKKFRETV